MLGILMVKEKKVKQQINLPARVWNAIKKELDENGFEIKRKNIRPKRMCGNHGARISHKIKKKHTEFKGKIYEM